MTMEIWIGFAIAFVSFNIGANRGFLRGQEEGIRLGRQWKTQFDSLQVAHQELINNVRAATTELKSRMQPINDLETLKRMKMP